MTGPGRLLPPAALLLLLSAPAAASDARTVTKCPEGTKARRTVDPRRPWACVLTDERYRDGIECPSGSAPVTLADTYDPFKCGLKGLRVVAPRGICPPGERAIPTSNPDLEFECEKVGKGFGGGPRCPRGTRPVPTPGALQPFKCAPEGQRSEDPIPDAAPAFPEPEPAGAKRGRRRAKPPEVPRRDPRVPDEKGECPPGMRKLVTENPFEPVQCVRGTRDSKARLRFRPYRAGGEIGFSAPEDWSYNDDWRGPEPSVYILLQAERDGRPVSLSVTRRRRGVEGFVPLEERVWQEQDWHSAQDKGRGTVGGLPARHLEAPDGSAVTFVETGDGYYTLAYSAPPELFDYYADAYRTLLRTFQPLK